MSAGDEQAFGAWHGLGLRRAAVDPATDQRGVARVDVLATGTRICDSGAFEFVPAP